MSSRKDTEEQFRKISGGAPTRPVQRSTREQEAQRFETVFTLILTTRAPNAEIAETTAITALEKMVGVSIARETIQRNYPQTRRV